MICLLLTCFLWACASTVSPTPAPNSSVILPAGTFQTDCLKVGSFYNRATLVITSPPSTGQSNGFTYTNELYLSQGCTSFDARLVALTSQIIVTPTSPGEGHIDVHVTTLNVTIGNAFLVSAASTCDGGGWVTGQTRSLNQSCIVFGVPLPSPRDCPVYYSSIRYSSTDIQIADFFSANGTNITCSLAQRFTNFSAAANYKLGGYGLAPSTCEPISNASICAPFINYPIGVPICNNCSQSNCQSLQLESDLFLTVLPQVWSVLESPSCRAGVGRLFCSYVYPRCNSSKQLPCSIACDLTTYCSGLDRQSLDRLVFLLGKNTSDLCSNVNCAVPPPVPALPIKSPNLDNVVPMSALTPSPAVGYPTCAVYNGNVCKGVVNGKVYVPGNTTLQQMEALFHDQIWFTFGLAPKGTCYRAFTELACATVFNPCDTTAVDSVLARLGGSGPSVPVPLPRIPCRSMCTAYALECKDFIALAPEILTRNCLGKADVVVGCDSGGKTFSNGTGLELYPVNQTILEPTLQLATDCNVVSVATEAPFECNFPTLRPESETSETILDSHCAFPCDSKVLSPWATAGWNRFFSAMLVISFFACGWTALTFFLFRDQLLKSQTQIYAFHCIIAVFVSTTIPIPVVFYDPSTAITYATCIDNTRPMTIEVPYCGYTGLVVTWSTLTTGLFLNAFVCDLFLVVTLLNQRCSKKNRDRFASGTFIGIYAFTLFFVIGTGATGALHHSNLPYCFVSGDASDALWSILCFSLVVDIALFTWVCKVIISSFRTITVSGSKPSGRSVASQYRRPLMFTVTFILLFFVAIVFRIQVRYLSDEWTEQTKDWAFCNLIDSRLTGAQCAEYPPGPNHGFYWLCSMLIFSQGLIITVIFGLTNQNFKLWRVFLVSKVFPKIGLITHSDRHGDSDFDRSSRNVSLRSTKKLDVSSHGVEAGSRVESPQDKPALSPKEKSAPKEPQTPKEEKAAPVESAPAVSRQRTGSLFLSASPDPGFVPFD